MPKEDFNQAINRKAPPPYSIRFSWEERSELDRLTGGGSWASYIKGAIFTTGQRIRKKYHEIDRQLIAKLLGALGKSRISSNINQLAKAANSGSLPVNEEVTQALLSACRTIEWMRITLIEALGLKAHKPNTIEYKPYDPER